MKEQLEMEHLNHEIISFIVSCEILVNIWQILDQTKILVNKNFLSKRETKYLSICLSHKHKYDFVKLDQNKIKTTSIFICHSKYFSVHLLNVGWCWCGNEGRSNS